MNATSCRIAVVDSLLSSLLLLTAGKGWSRLPLRGHRQGRHRGVETAAGEGVLPSFFFFLYCSLFFSHPRLLARSGRSEEVDMPQCSTFLFLLFFPLFVSSNQRRRLLDALPSLRQADKVLVIAKE